MRKGRLFLILWSCVWTLTCLHAASSVAGAAGFALYEYSARGNAMAGALVATQRPDASSVAFNPATMTMLSDPEIMAGLTVITPKAKVVRNGVENDVKPQTFFVPHAYYVQPITDRVTFGVGEFTRFGLGTEYDKYWPGSAELESVLFESYSVNPNIAFKVTEDFSIAFGVEIMRANVEIRRNVLGGMKLQSDGYSIGADLGLFYRFNDEWAMGFVARTPMHLVGEGGVSTGAGVHGSLTMTTNLPDSYTLGLSYTPTEDLSIEVDAVYTRWEQYKNFKYDFGPETGLADTTLWKHWRNVWRFQLGAEYLLTDWVALRAGYVWDQEPIRRGYEDYMLPGNDRQMVNGGVGFTWDALTLDLSYSYLWAKNRTGFSISGVPVEFRDNRTHLFGATVGYTF